MEIESLDVFMRRQPVVTLAERLLFEILATLQDGKKPSVFEKIESIKKETTAVKPRAKPRKRKPVKKVIKKKEGV